jgi:hypothetical protein
MVAKHSLWTMAAPVVRPHDVRRHHRLLTFDVTAVANKPLNTLGSTQILSDMPSSTFQPLKPSRTPLRLPGATPPKPSSPPKTPASSKPIAPANRRHSNTTSTKPWTHRPRSVHQVLGTPDKRRPDNLFRIVAPAARPSCPPPRSHQAHLEKWVNTIYHNLLRYTSSSFGSVSCVCAIAKWGKPYLFTPQNPQGHTIQAAYKAH